MAFSALGAVWSLDLSSSAGVPREVQTITTTLQIAPAPVPWPATGESALSIPAIGLTMESAPERPVPIASLTKMMTAYVVLRDHPLASAEDGPQLTMSSLDQADATYNVLENATSIPVTAGELLSERQVLSGALVHSANDLADALARWDAGAIETFVGKMNQTASLLGMTSTHYSDPTGYGAASVSTASDQLRLAAAAMALPAFASVVAQPTVLWPGIGPLGNFVPGVGTAGVVGVKSGFTRAAMGCVVLAADRVVAGRPVLVLAAVTGQGGTDPLGLAAGEARALTEGVAADVHDVVVVHAHQPAAAVSLPWGPSIGPARKADPHRSPPNTGVVADPAAEVHVLGWPGEVVHVRLEAARLRVGSPGGTPAGSLVVTSDSVRQTVPLYLGGRIPTPGVLWRLLHG